MMQDFMVTKYICNLLNLCLFSFKERLVPDNESILTTLLEWGSDLEDVKFYLHRSKETPAFTQALNGKI